VRIYNAYGIPIHRLGKKVGAHISDKNLLLINFRHIVELEALDGLIVAIMKIGRILIDFPFRLVRNEEFVFFVLRYSSNLIHIAENLSLCDCSSTPVTSVDIVCGWIVSEKI